MAYYNSGAAAKVVFANLTDEEQENIIQQPSHRFTDNTRSWDELMQEVPQIRQNGYSISDEEVDAGVFAIGAPIFDSQGKVTAGKAMATLKYYLTIEQIGNMITLSVNTSSIISSKIGFSKA